MVVFGLQNEPSQPTIAKYMAFLLKILPLAAFAAPMAILYLINPIDPYLNVSVQASFELMWKGRTFEVFFLWLVALEFILGWDSIKAKINKQNKLHTILLAVSLLLPTIYVVLQYAGLNGAIAYWAQQSGVAFSNSMPLAAEYLAFSAIFCIVTFAAFGKKGLASFALPALFAALIGVLYMIDNVFPYGAFTPFQLLVPTTASLAAGVLSWMGNVAVPGVDAASGMPTLDVTGTLGSAKFAIAWPCAGIESLLIFTAVALLFLKRMDISRWAKVGFFVIGAAVTYLINVMRIANIFLIGMQYGVDSVQVQNFHYYYGPLYAMTWIVAYPLVILVGIWGWRKIRTRQPAQLNPA